MGFPVDKSHLEQWMCCCASSAADGFWLILPLLQLFSL